MKREKPQFFSSRKARLFSDRKGTEKPIEIFVALFIILAVALVMLKLFQSQIAEKQKELSDVQQEQKSRELRNKVDQACKDKCVEASNNQCSPASLAALCAYSSRNVLGDGTYIDLDNTKTKNMDTTLLAGIGVCEDRVYCFHLVGSCCAQQISPQSCKQILRNYWEGTGVIPRNDAEEFSEMLDRTIKATDDPSSCPAPSANALNKRWDQLATWTG